jgi:hypothetical protein
MTPIIWTEAHRSKPTWQAFYPYVAQQTRAYLRAHPLAEDGTLSTHELVEVMFPEQLAVGEGIVARRRIYKALMALTIRDLADCCTRGPKQKLFGPTKGGPAVRPWRWHQPTVANNEHINCCPKCGQELF